MTQSEYEKRLRLLEEQRLAGIELLEAGYRAQVSALDQLRAQETGAATPAPPEAANEAPTALPEARPPRRRKGARRRPRRTLREEVVAALAQVPEVFTKHDVAQKLGDPPDRGSLFRILDDLVHEGRLKVDSPGSGTLPTQYRRVARVPSR